MTPTPTTPATMRVAVEVAYVRACQECRRLVEQTAQAAIVDASVTSLRLVPSSKHACGRTDATKAFVADTRAEALGSVQAAELPFAVSDTNGSHPDAVGPALFTSAELTAMGANNIPNGFDREVA